MQPELAPTLADVETLYRNGKLTDAIEGGTDSLLSWRPSQRRGNSTPGSRGWRAIRSRQGRGVLRTL